MADIHLIGSTLTADSETKISEGTSITITEAPAGTFTISAGPASYYETDDNGAGTVCSQNVNTTVLTHIMAKGGVYNIFANVTAAVAGTTVTRVIIAQNGGSIGRTSVESSTGATVQEISFPIMANVVTCNAGDTMTIKIEPNMAAATQTYLAKFNAIQIA